LGDTIGGCEIARSGTPMIDVDTIARYLSLLTGGPFRLGDAGDFLVRKERVKWFLWPTYPRAVPRTSHVHVAWIEQDDTVHIETERLGNTSDTTRWMYGDQALHEFVNMDLTGFEEASVREEYAKRFPQVVGRLETYQRFASKMSEKLGVQMELLLDGGKGLATFRLEARFGAQGMATPLVLHEIDRSIAALGQVYYEIAERQKRIYFTWALPANRAGGFEE
jgi:hypothetical protein